MDGHDDHCCFGEWAAADARRARSGKRVGGISRDLVEALDGIGLSGRTVLDLGCGAGAVAIEAVDRGAYRATGLDLSDVAIDEARRLSLDSGTSDRTSFAVGDGSVAALERHDVVVLNRVFCCYPAVDRLLANSITASGWAYAFTVPASRGWRGVVARAMCRIENAWYRLRRVTFRAFVHDLRLIEDALRRGGFREIVARRTLVWDLRVFVRGDGGDRSLAASAAAVEPSVG